MAGVLAAHPAVSQQSVGGASAAATEAGTALFQSQCASCHGMQGQGTAYGPSLVGAGAAGADFYLRTGRMPLSAPGQPVVRRQPVLTEEQIQELVDVVASLVTGRRYRRSRAAVTSPTARGCTSPTVRPATARPGRATRSAAATSRRTFTRRR